MRFPLVSLLLATAVAVCAQVERPLVLNRSQYTVTAGGSIALEAAPEAVTFMKSAKTRAARASNRAFPVAPEYKGARMMLGVPLATPPGDYEVSLSFAGTQEDRAAVIRIHVEPWAQPRTASLTPPVVLLDGLQLSLQGSCPIPQDSSGTFGHLQQYLEGAPNNVANVYFFENCTECPECAIETLGAELASFLNSLAAPEVDVVAHSMGGLIVRSYLAGKSTTSGVFNPPPAVKIRKAVFLATPHFGSPLADEASTNVLLSSLYGNDLQIEEMERGSQFAWDLATWNQFADDLRGVDAVAVIGNAGPSGQSDGVVDLTSASLDFAEPSRTRVVPYCHIASSDVGGLAGAITGCNGPGIAYIDSPSHPSYQVVSSFLMSGTAWQSVGDSPAQDPVLSVNGGMLVGEVTASNQYVETLKTVTWGGTSLSDGAAAGELFYDDFVAPGTADFSLVASGSNSTSWGPYTEHAGLYSTLRCKSGPAIASVTPLVSGPAETVASGGSITISGVGFGPQQCAACTVKIAGAKPATLSVSSWSDSNIVASLAPFSGLMALEVTTADGSDSINIMTAGTAVPGLSITAVTNSASGMTGAVAPGEVVAIYGTNLGPAAGISGLDGNLGGVRVLFGTVAAPILYASAWQINAVVPYEIAGQSQVPIAIEYQSQPATATLPVASAAPGIYTLTASGTGQAVAIDQDGSVNGPANPAAKGSYVTIYFTGGGQTNPPGVTGSITGLGLKWLTQAISVTVGNQPATVQFDGSAPTLVDGVDQLNILLAPNTPSGAQPVVLAIGGISSTANATISVK
ncbi:MAG TPA: IPT/TIG domain-containing protein [Bryobacteraceae bacterium]|nr:IPT/TIG domain-containing protein [Bryobacteraceae bacterium]